MVAAASHSPQVSGAGASTEFDLSSHPTTQHFHDVIAHEDRPKDLLQFLANPKWVIDDTKMNEEPVATMNSMDSMDPMDVDANTNANTKANAKTNTIGTQTELNVNTMDLNNHHSDHTEGYSGTYTCTAEGEQTTHIADTSRLKLSKRDLSDVNRFLDTLDTELATIYDDPDDSRSIAYE